MQTVLITGANGFTGSHLKLILSNNFSVVATGRQPDPVMNKGLCFYQMDITSKEQVIKVFDAVKPDVVVHLAALSKPDECEQNRLKAYGINTRAVSFLLEASASCKTHFIFLSTDFVFDGEKGMYTEEDLPSPVNYYGETKFLAEQLVKQYPYDWCIIRTVLVYGSSEGTRENILTSAAKDLAKGKKLNIVNDQIRTPTHVDDLCMAIKAAIEKKAQGIFHISGKDVLTPYEMVMATAEFLNLDGSLVHPVTQESFSQPARRPLKTGFNISKAVRELGYDPVSFQEGLKKTFH
jgi:dTDP-4-dehydrorhamnose reductase